MCMLYIALNWKFFYIFQRKAKTIERREKREKENSKRRETKVASKQKQCKIYLKIIGYIYAAVFVYVYLYVVHATISDSYLNQSSILYFH